jgi:hypothetical protein
MADGFDHWGTATCPVGKLAQFEPQETLFHYLFDASLIATSLATALA